MNFTEIVFIIALIKKAEELGYKFETETNIITIRAPISEYGNTITITQLNEFNDFIQSILHKNMKNEC